MSLGQGRGKANSLTYLAQIPQNYGHKMRRLSYIEYKMQCQDKLTILFLALTFFIMTPFVYGQLIQTDRYQSYIQHQQIKQKRATQKEKQKQIFIKNLSSKKSDLLLKKYLSTAPPYRSRKKAKHQLEVFLKKDISKKNKLKNRFLKQIQKLKKERQTPIFYDTISL